MLLLLNGIHPEAMWGLGWHTVPSTSVMHFQQCPEDSNTAGKMILLKCSGVVMSDVPAHMCLLWLLLVFQRSRSTPWRQPHPTQMETGQSYSMQSSCSLNLGQESSLLVYRSSWMWLNQPHGVLNAKSYLIILQKLRVRNCNTAFSCR